jgi:hypothetical protein
MIEGAVFADPRRAQLTAELTLRRFDLDDAGAHVGEQHRASRAGADMREVEDGQSVEGMAQHDLFLVCSGSSDAAERLPRNDSGAGERGLGGAQVP